jgi:hypothetical protein
MEKTLFIEYYLKFIIENDEIKNIVDKEKYNITVKNKNRIYNGLTEKHYKNLFFDKYKFDEKKQESNKSINFKRNQITQNYFIMTDTDTGKEIPFPFLTDYTNIKMASNKIINLVIRNYQNNNICKNMVDYVPSSVSTLEFVPTSNLYDRRGKLNNLCNGLRILLVSDYIGVDYGDKTMCKLPRNIIIINATEHSKSYKPFNVIKLFSQTLILLTEKSRCVYKNKILTEYGYDTYENKIIIKYANKNNSLTRYGKRTYECGEYYDYDNCINIF